MADLIDIIRGRRSIRSYKEQEVEGGKIKRILEAGRWAPTAGNQQCLEYIVVKDQDTRIRLMEASHGQDQVAQAPVNIVVCFNREKNVRYGERGETLYCGQESGGAILNMMLMAHSLGLGTCWIGAFGEKEASEILGIPDHVRPVAIITLGYPSEDGSSKRRDPEELVHVEKY